jgi:hypothetical protein
MSDYEQAVLVSYAWGGEREEIVNKIDQALQQRKLKIIRDKRDLGYKGSIREFMERIGQGNCVIVVVSDKYLRSENCMFELVEIAENKQFQDRIFPVVLADADIYKPVKQIQYVKYWEEQIKELKEGIQGVDPTNLQGIYEKLNLYDRIRDNISNLIAILSDMNTLTPAMHQDSDFSTLYEAVVERMQDAAATSKNSTPNGETHSKEKPAIEMERKPMDTEQKDEKSPVNSARIKGDQNISSGNVSSGGISFQGGRHKNITINQSTGPASDEVAALFSNLYKHIESRPPDPNVEKEEILETVQKIQEEASKGEKEANETKLTRWIDSLNKIAPDVIDVALASLGGPVSGVTAVLKKIADRAHQQPQS